MSFVHLHVHSQYSLLESTIQAKKLTKRVESFGQPAVALTDLGNMFGCIEFYFAARAVGVKPLLGLEVYVAPESRHKRGEGRDPRPNTRLVLLAQNLKGYQNLCALSSIGFQEGFYYKPRVDYEVLKEYNSDLIVMTGGLQGEIPWQFINRGKEEALRRIDQLKEIFPERLYLEMNRTGVKAWDEINPFLVEASKIKSVPLVAANDVHYLDSSDQQAQEVLICIGSNKTLQDESRFRLGSDQFYLKTSESMEALFKDQPEAISNTLEIMNRCDVEFQLSDSDGKPIYHLPSFPTTEGRSLSEEMKAISLDGLDKRVKEADLRGEPIANENKSNYLERLDYELQVIGKMGFEGYFLIVQDFIRWAKDNGIPVGPGRGSGAGSLVAYCLGITDLDPMPYNLIFERFLNPERISMPDFDIDFCQENRGRVIDYVTEKYGQPSVSQIITYGKLQARAAIRDVGRVLGMTYAEVDIISKLMPDKLGLTLAEALELEPRIGEAMEMDPKVQTLLELAQNVEGLVRHAGIHAAGVVIADGRIMDHAPLYRGADGENVVQYDMKHAEKIGLIKFDFLGLKTLTHIQYALDLIKSNQGKLIRTQEISMKDPGIYEIMCLGDTAGIFQFEGEGITDLIRKAQPNCFEDIVAINALYRPGPMDMIPDYLKRKKGEKKVDYFFEELESVLSETYGIVVYQEQVQMIAAKIANYSLGEADMLRRAMGKKIAEEMLVHRDRFLKGAKENHFDTKKAEELFDTMAEFAKYGFNKSHAAAYCVVAAQTAYLKHYYPVEFYAALLSTEMSDTDKVVKYVKDAASHKIRVHSPHINHSDFKFSVKGDEIFFSLGAIKGVGEGAVESIVHARAEQPGQKFESIEHFFENIDLRKVNKKTIEALIKSGAFDGFGVNRAELLGGFPRYIERAERVRQEKEVGQTSLFSMGDPDSSEEKVVLDKKEAMPKSARLALEKEVLGFYLSDHPLKGYGQFARLWKVTDIDSLAELKNKSNVVCLGLVESLREIITKKGTRMAFAQLEDLTGRIELVIFPDSYAKLETILKSDSPICLSGAIETEKGSPKILVDHAKRVDEIFSASKKWVIHLRPQMTGQLEELKDLLLSHPGPVPYQFKVWLDEPDAVVDLEPQESGLSPNRELLERMQSMFGDQDFIEFSKA